MWGLVQLVGMVDLLELVGMVVLLGLLQHLAHKYLSSHFHFIKCYYLYDFSFDDFECYSISVKEKGIYCS